MSLGDCHSGKWQDYMFEHCEETCGVCNSGKYQKYCKWPGMNLIYTLKPTNVNYAKWIIFFLDFLELDEDTRNETKMNETEDVDSLHQEKGKDHGLTFFVTGMIILILGIITLIVISRIFWLDWNTKTIQCLENTSMKLLDTWNKHRKFNV